MAQGKIDRIVMEAMYKEGKSTSEIAAYFHCTTTAVKKMRQRVERKYEIVPATGESRKSLAVADQLVTINKLILDELGRAQRLIVREDNKIKEREFLEDLMKSRPGDAIVLAKLEAMGGVDHSAALKIQTSLIALSAEIRKQLEFQVKVFAEQFNAVADAQFRDIVLSVIAETSPEIRDEVIAKLKKVKSLYGLVQRQG